MVKIPKEDFLKMKVDSVDFISKPNHWLFQFSEEYAQDKKIFVTVKHQNNQFYVIKKSKTLHDAWMWIIDPLAGNMSDTKKSIEYLVDNYL